MALDRTNVQMFRTLETMHGLKFIESMVRGQPMPGGSGDPKAVLYLAKLAEEYLQQVHRLTVVLSEKQVIHRKRMERYVRECQAREQAGRTPPPAWEVPRTPSRNDPPPKGMSVEEWEEKKASEYRKKFQAVRERDAQRAAAPAEPEAVKRPRRVTGDVKVEAWIDGRRYMIDKGAKEVMDGLGLLDG